MPDPNQADDDQPRKKGLGLLLFPKLKQLDDDIVKTFAAVLNRQGFVIDVASRATEVLESILFEHYMITGQVFKGDLRDQLPATLAMTEEERIRVDVALTTHFRTRAKEQAAAILATTQTNMERSWQTAKSEEDSGDPLFQTVIMASAGLSRLLARRRPVISQLESEAPAEDAKATEAEVLTGSLGLSVLGQEVTSQLVKRWDNMQDEKVRDHHVDAGGQIRLINEPFLVMGQYLMRPKDTSLGATVRNIINCRCSAFYPMGKIIQIREEMQLAA